MPLHALNQYRGSPGPLSASKYCAHSVGRREATCALLGGYTDTISGGDSGITVNETVAGDTPLLVNSAPPGSAMVISSEYVPGACCQIVTGMVVVIIGAVDEVTGKRSSSIVAPALLRTNAHNRYPLVGVHSVAPRLVTWTLIVPRCDGVTAGSNLVLGSE